MPAQKDAADRVRELAADLLREQGERLWKIAKEHAHTEDDAEEAISETMASFIKCFDPDGNAPPAGWFVLALKRQCWRQRRDAHWDLYAGQEARRGDEEHGIVIDALRSHRTGTEDRIANVSEARLRLSAPKDDERTALGAAAAGYSYAEIARLHGWSTTKVKRCIREGRQTLTS